MCPLPSLWTGGACTTAWNCRDVTKGHSRLHCVTHAPPGHRRGRLPPAACRLAPGAWRRARAGGRGPAYNPAMATLFVSDLHLDPARPEITALFLRFLRGEAAGADALYILGDLFEAWVGDDDPSEAG